MNYSSRIKKENGFKNKGTYTFLSYVIVFVGLFIATAILFPDFVSIIFNIIWILLFTVVIIFFSVGFLVIFGLRKEASQILDVLLEGSLTFIDFIEFLKLIYRRFVEIMIDFLIFSSPIIAYIVSFICYLLILLLYKAYGRSYDITIFTVILTFVLVGLVGVLNRPQLIKPDLEKWTSKFKEKFRRAFIDGLEVVLFVFFLTMDSTNLFFLPKDLNIPLRSDMFGFDFMVRSFSQVEIRLTINLIIIVIITEIIRNIFRIIAVARVYYREGVLKISSGGSYTQIQLIKNAIRKSFNDLKDDVVKFIATMTLLFAVFLIFPKLKLVTLAIASITSMILDVAIPSRLTVEKGEDLISRILAKVFKL